jgi:Predicted membrane protein
MRRLEQEQRSNFSVPEIDVWRGLAVVFMVLNHAGFALLSSDSKQNLAVRIFLHITSHAPVLFFFITGVGYGISRGWSGAARKVSGVFYKGVILILIDLLIRISHKSIGFGWDFLGFIAASMLILHAVQSVKRPVMLALGLACACIFMRFFMLPILNRVVPDGFHYFGWIEMLLGARSVPNCSYWFIPWLCYPLLGFVAGYMYADARLSSLRESLSNRFFLLCCALTLPTLIVLSLDLSYFRWGTVSFAFFVSSFAVLIWTYYLACKLVVGGEKFSLLLKLRLRGINCLLVVPIHYILIYGAAMAGWDDLWAGSFCVVSFAIICMSFWAGNRVGALTQVGWMKRPATVIVLYIIGLSSLVIGYMNVGGARDISVIFLVSAFIVSPLIALPYRMQRARVVD